MIALKDSLNLHKYSLYIIYIHDEISKVKNILMSSLDQIFTHSVSLRSVVRYESTHETLESLPWVLTGSTSIPFPLPGAVDRLGILN